MQKKYLTLKIIWIHLHLRKKEYVSGVIINFSDNIHCWLFIAARELSQDDDFFFDVGHMKFIKNLLLNLQYQIRIDVSVYHIVCCASRGLAR